MSRLGSWSSKYVVINVSVHNSKSSRQKIGQNSTALKSDQE